jgi:hypothetical protein
MKPIWGAWRNEGGIWSRFRQWWVCDHRGHDAGPDEEQCKRCGARRVRLTSVYPGVKGHDGDPKPAA